jgi:nicotinate phosphoribosyltransferase
MYDLKDRKFWLATEDEISKGLTTDAYFINTKKVIDDNKLDNEVVMEVFARSVPYDQKWGVVTGIYDVAKLLEGLPIDVDAYEEGGIFLADGAGVAYEPLVVIRGRYKDFLEFENPVLGMLCSNTSVSTRAARFRIAAGGRMLLSFGTRRTHPVLAPMVERACYIAGFDGVSNVIGASLLGVEASGTMPHALMQLVGDQATAWKLFDKSLPPGVHRTILADTFWDEKAEAIKAFETLGPRLWGLRFDTPGSRRGNFKKILEEVRWELDIRGGKSVNLIASGNLEEDDLLTLKDVADGFGVGTAVAYPPVIDFSAKIVEVKVDGKTEYRSKRGGLAGEKTVVRSPGFKDTVGLAGTIDGAPLLSPLIRSGKIVRRLEPAQDIRLKLLPQLKAVSESQPELALSS